MENIGTVKKVPKKFIPYLCECKVCTAINTAQYEWNVFLPTNPQKRMISVTEKSQQK